MEHKINIDRAERKVFADEVEIGTLMVLTMAGYAGEVVLKTEEDKMVSLTKPYHRWSGPGLEHHAVEVLKPGTVLTITVGGKDTF